MTPAPVDLENVAARLQRARLLRSEGVVLRVVGLAVESQGPACSVGEDCLQLHDDPSAVEDRRRRGLRD